MRLLGSEGQLIHSRADKLNSEGKLINGVKMIASHLEIERDSLQVVLDTTAEKLSTGIPYLLMSKVMICRFL